MQKPIVAERFYSGFKLAHDTYNALSVGSDGRIYYILCSEVPEEAGKMCMFDPVTESTEILADLNDICGQDRVRYIAQGKSHVEFIEKHKVLYFASHVGHYEMIDGMERLPRTIVENRQLYPGGHFISYDLVSKEFIDLGIGLEKEGILTMAMDTIRDVLFGISWPTGHFLSFDLRSRTTTDYGLVSERGEAGMVGQDYRVLCRSIFVQPKTGHAYFTNAEGDIFYCDPVAGQIIKRDDAHMRLDYFGTYDVAEPGSMGYNWRKIFWHPTEEAAFGVHGNSGYLFRFDPEGSAIELIDRITSMPSRKFGMFDQFTYGYLGFTYVKKSNTIYYLTGAPIFEKGLRVAGERSIPRGGAKGPENLHLITFNLTNYRYTDHGPIFFRDGTRPSFVNSLAVGKDGYVYTLGRMNHSGNVIADLIRVKDPLA